MKKITSTLFAAVLGMFVMASVAPMAVADGTGVHKVAIHVNENNAKVMNLALNNVANVNKYYASKGEKVIIEVVAYGPGLNMFRPEKSPVKDRIEKMSLMFENLSFAACGNTRKKMAAKEGKKISIIPEATMVTSGVVRLIELQEKGYAYVKP